MVCGAIDSWSSGWHRLRAHSPTMRGVEMRFRSGRAAGTAIALAAASAVLFFSSPAHDAKASGPPHTGRLVLFSSDGMRPDLMQKYADLGLMPTYKALVNAGVRGDNG